MKIITNTGGNRKPLVKCLSELLNQKPRYTFAPSFAYEFSHGTLDKEGTFHLVPTLNAHAAERLARLLAEQGFPCTVEDEDTAPDGAQASGESLEIETEPFAREPDCAPHFTVTVGREAFDEADRAKLEAVIASKANLLRKALGSSDLGIIESPEGFTFPWFQIEADPEEQQIYRDFIDKLIAFACQLTRVTARDKPAPNDKYAMRCWLLRLGFIGKEYKAHRALLLRDLEGNGAFKSGSDPRKNPA